MSSPTEIPTDEDWHSEPWDLDGPWVYDVFFGKTREEAFELFAEFALSREEDLCHMPFRCFRFYVWPYIEYLLDDRSQGDSDGANGFISLTEFCREEIQAVGEDLVNAVTGLLKRIGERQAWYDADEHIYGDLREKADRVLALYNARG